MTTIATRPLRGSGAIKNHNSQAIANARLQAVSSNPTLREYAQGAAQSAIQPVAAFIAPSVDVPTTTGKYKIYDEKHRFRLPNTRRPIGGQATVLTFDVGDATFNCEPHALDYPVDNLELLNEAQLENRLREGATATAEVAGLVHEKDVIDKAAAAAGAGTDISVAEDIVDGIDASILEVIKAAKYGSLMGVRVLFGATAWRRTKNSAKVRDRYNPAAKKVAVPSLGDFSTLLIAEPECRVSLMVFDAAPEGKAEEINFLFDASILVFATKPDPTRRDPSFMKTFRLMGRWMVPGSYTSTDGRVEFAKFDWSEDVKVTNTQAVRRLNVTA
jgi:hypothetical protein